MPSSLRLLWVILLLSSFPLLAQSPQAAAGTQLVFTKTFEGSLPEYSYVAVWETGDAVYRGHSEEDAEKQEFRLSGDLTARLFSLAAALNWFEGIELEARPKVAYMGLKTFACEKGGRRSSVSFNFTQDPTALELQRLFEAIALGRFYYERLEHRLLYDRLGVLELLRQFERDYAAGRLVDMEQFVPLLERIANDRGLARMAQTRATELLRRIQRGGARLEMELVEKRAGLFYRLVIEEPNQAFYESRLIGESPRLQPADIPSQVVSRLLELAQLASYFRGAAIRPEDEASPLLYRFLYEAGPEQNRATFASPSTAALSEMVHIFRQVIQQFYFQQRFEESLAGKGEMVVVVLQELEKMLGRDGLVDPGRFAPQLEAIANGGDYDSHTRELAARLLEQIRTSSK